MNTIDALNKKIVFDFIKQHHLAVLSTVSGDMLPEASVVGFDIEQKNADFEIRFVTFDSSRKHANLKRNPRVAMVIGWDHGKTIQIEGEAFEVTDSEDVKEIEWKNLEKMPTVAKYINPERAVFYKIIPKSLRYSDYSTEPWQRIELKFL